MTSGLLPAAVLVPLAFAVAAALPRGRAAIWTGIAGAAVSAVLAGLIAVVVGASGPLTHQLAGWDTPLGIRLHADGLGATFLALTAVVGLATAAYAAASPATYGKNLRFWPLLLMLWAGLAGVFVAGDLFTTYVTLEVVTLSAVGLVALGGRDAWAPALRYLLVAVVGSLLYLVAVGAIYGMSGSLDLVEAGAALADRPAADTRWPLALAVVGLGLKTAAFPLHAWLPPAHSAAPAAVSPLLSGLVIKASFVVLVRLWFDVLGPDDAVATVLAICAAGAILGGGILGLVQRRLKRVVAYSSVVQVGYLVLIFPLTTFADDEGAVRTIIAGIAALAVAHGLSKAGAFQVAGALKLAAGTDDLDGVVGAARKQGTLSLSMMLAAISLVGLPISLGFAGKWLVITGAIASGQWWAVALVLVGSILTAGYLLRPVAAVLRDSDTTEEVGRADVGDLPPGLRYVPLTLGLLVIALGLVAVRVTDLALVGWGGTP